MTDMNCKIGFAFKERLFWLLNEIIFGHRELN